MALGTGYDIGTTSAVAGAIADDDSTVTLAVSPGNVQEDGTPNLIYTFTRSGNTSEALTVNYTVGGTATFNTDYSQTGGTSFSATSGTMTFAAGSSTATLTIDPTVDTTVEPDETVALTLTSGSYKIGTTNAVSGTIINDDASVSLAVSPSSLQEDGTQNLIYTFTRTGVTTNSLTVNYTIGGTATLNTDYTRTGTTNTVTFAAGSSTATVTIDPTADTIVEPDETVILTLAAGTGYAVGTTTPVTGTINDDELPSITLAVSPASVTEDGTTNLIYTFTRSGLTTNSLTVNYTLGGTATLNTDYTRTGTTNTVTFAAGSSTATVTIDPTADTIVEPDETVILTLAAGTGYAVGTTTPVTGTINDDELPSITLAVSPASVTEDGTTNLIYTFTRSGLTTNSLTVNYTLRGTATLNTDYTRTGTNNTVTFAAGSSTATVTIDPTPDTIVESNETVALTLAAGTGYTVGTTTPVTGTITNASATGQYASSVIAFSSQYSSSSWSAEQALGQPNTFSYGDISTSWAPSTRNGDGDAQADEFITVGFSTPVYADGIEIRETWGNGFVRSIDLLDNQGVYHSIWSGVDPSLPGNPVNFRVNFQPTNYLVVGAKINVDIDHDTRTWEEIDSVQLFGVGDVISNITLAVAPASVTEDGTTNLIYTFTRNGVTTNPLTVNYTLGGTATLNTDYTRTGTNNTVTFAANSTTATVTVDPKTDTTVESNETIALTLASGTGYTVGTTTPVTGTITNDDFSKLSINNITVVEGKDNNAILTVTVNNPNPQPITVNYTTAPINATANVDYTSKTGTITIAPNTSTATITIPILNDNLNEANETFAINLSNPVNATLTNNKGIVTISDTLTANVTTTLPANVENLTLTGTTNINGTGNTLNNVITGNSGNNILNGSDGNDTLIGGTGNDTITGGAGSDRFTFNNRNEGIDTITDFLSSQGDKIALSAAGFGSGLAAGVAITAAQFVLGTTALNASNRFIYNTITGRLFFDGDGTGTLAAIQIATLSSKPTLTASNILVLV
ncbi:Endo-1,3-1,4-beta-glycanase ExsH [Microcystis aeruginosa SPC777]|uniref:Endo-1,3-1,4-beta-glycanase ExsH n=1 Tax=Microcystis aeruginosa SPC777 TaxID=482300 RepID=S3JGG6_MICAE|nr:Endo-1,3-1,4-beta-glycanase ExsH [Microcystis aeruginosa SPC777]